MIKICQYLLVREKEFFKNQTCKLSFSLTHLKNQNPRARPIASCCTLASALPCHLRNKREIVLAVSTMNYYENSIACQIDYPT